MLNSENPFDSLPDAKAPVTKAPANPFDSLPEAKSVKAEQSSANPFDALPSVKAPASTVKVDGEAKRTEGFIDNVRWPWDSLQDALASPARGALDEGFIQRGVRAALTDEKELAARRKKAEEHPQLKLLNSLSAEMDEMEARGEDSTPEYRQLESEFYKTMDEREQEAPPSVPVLTALADAVKEDAGAVAAELTNAIIADPVLAAIPAGWELLAAKSAAAVAKYGKAAKAAASVAGGATGAAATGAAITVPISVAQQFEEEGSVDLAKVAEDARLAGALSVPIVGITRGLSNLSRLRITRSPTDEAFAHQSAGSAATANPNATLQEALQDAYAGMSETARAFVEPFGMKSVTKLDRAAKLSPSFKKIRDTLEYTEFSETPIGPSYWERTYLENGRFGSRLQETMDELSGTFSRRISKETNDALLKGLRGADNFDGAGKGGKVAPVVQNLRKLADDFHDYMTKSGLEPGFVKNYFPRIYKPKVLLTDKGRIGMSRVLQKYGIEAEAADDIITRIVTDDGVYITPKKDAERIVDGEGNLTLGRIGAGGASRNVRFETARKLSHIPDSELAPYLEDNVYDVLKRYISSGVKRAEYARAFGVGEGKVNDLLRKSIQEATENGGQIRRDEIQRVYDLMDTMQHKYRPVASRAVREAQRGLGAYQLFRTLGLATISSLSEPLVILARGRTSSTIKAVPAVLSHASRSIVRSVFKKFPKAEATRALENVGIGLDIGVTERMMASFGGETSRATEKFFKLTLLHQFTKLNRVAGYHAGRLMIADNLRDIAKGVKGAKRTRLLQQLSELGVDAQEGIAWFNRGAPENDPFQETIKAGALRFTNEVVMDPRSTVRPMWHSDPHFHLLSQLKGFQTVFGNTVMKRFLHEVFVKSVKTGKKDGVKAGVAVASRNALKYATVGTMMIGVAMIGNDIREAIKYGPKGNPKLKDEKPYDRMMRAVDRAGFTGAGQIAIDSLYAHRFGSAGVVQALGPSVSQLEQLVFEGVGEALEGNTSSLKTQLTNAIPLINTNKATRNMIQEKYISPAVDAMPFPEKE